MVAKLISQASCLGVLGSTAYVSTIIDIADSPLATQEKAPDFKTPKDIPKFPSKAADVTIEDIELYEASGKCKFVFIDNSGKKQSFKARQWFQEKVRQTPEYKNWWKSTLTAGVFFEKHRCKNGKLILELQPGKLGSFKPKATL